MSVLLFSPVCEREWCVKLDSPVSPDIDWTGARMMAKIYVCSLFVKHFRSNDFPTYFFLSLLFLLRVRIHRFREYVWKWTVYRHGVNKPMTRCANIWFKRRIRPIDGSSTMNHDRIWPSIYFVPEDLSWNIKSTILFAFIVVKGSIASFDTIATVQFKIETSLWDLFTGRERERERKIQREGKQNGIQTAGWKQPSSSPNPLSSVLWIPLASKSSRLGMRTFARILPEAEEVYRLRRTRTTFVGRIDSSIE